jgi:hypothetical protein
MRIEFIVMEVNLHDGTQTKFPINNNNFTTQDAAEAAITNYFDKQSSGLLGPGPVLTVLKVFKGKN